MDSSTIFKHRGEAFLLAGLVAWCAAFAPYFPTLWRTGQFYVGPVALLLLLVSMWQARDRTATIVKQGLSLVLFLVALFAFYCSSLQSVTLAHQIFPPPLGALAPTSKDWTVTIAAWFISAVIWVLWLRSWTNWPRLHCYGWGAAVFGAHIAAMTGFWLILQTNTPRNLCVALLAPVALIRFSGCRRPNAAAPGADAGGRTDRPARSGA